MVNTSQLVHWNNTCPANYTHYQTHFRNPANSIAQETYLPHGQRFDEGYDLVMNVFSKTIENCFNRHEGEPEEEIHNFKNTNTPLKELEEYPVAEPEEENLILEGSYHGHFDSAHGSTQFDFYRFLDNVKSRARSFYSDGICYPGYLTLFNSQTDTYCLENGTKTNVAEETPSENTQARQFKLKKKEANRADNFYHKDECTPGYFEYYKEEGYLSKECSPEGNMVVTDYSDLLQKGF